MATVTINATAPLGRRIASALIGVEFPTALAFLASHNVVSSFLGRVDYEMTLDAAAFPPVDDVIGEVRFACLFGIDGAWSNYCDEHGVVVFDEPFADEVAS